MWNNKMVILHSRQGLSAKYADKNLTLKNEKQCLVDLIGIYSKQPVDALSHSGTLDSICLNWSHKNLTSQETSFNKSSSVVVKNLITQQGKNNLVGSLPVSYLEGYSLLRI